MSFGSILAAIHSTKLNRSQQLKKGTFFKNGHPDKVKKGNPLRSKKLSEASKIAIMEKMAIQRKQRIRKLVVGLVIISIALTLLVLWINTNIEPKEFFNK